MTGVAREWRTSSYISTHLSQSQCRRTAYQISAFRGEGCRFIGGMLLRGLRATAPCCTQTVLLQAQGLPGPRVQVSYHATYLALDICQFDLQSASWLAKVEYHYWQVKQLIRLQSRVGDSRCLVLTLEFGFTVLSICARAPETLIQINETSFNQQSQPAN